MSPDESASAGPNATRAPVQVGDVVEGKYRIERVLGSGGMGIVMAARHLTLDEPVALKFVLDRGGAGREVIERTMREARATFRLRSTNAVRVHDVGELPSGVVYIVMELLEGRDLRAELAARGPLPEKEVVAHVLDACDALEEAHALGIVHRDLKPHNLFLAKSLHGAHVKVLDFGMSKVDPALFEAQAGPLTRPETALGTPRYMAPEQWKSAAEVDARADIWALGVVMYELLTGSAPLQGMKPQDRHARLLGGAIPSPRDLRPEISEPVSRIVLRCLRADPASRWPSVVHLATALRDARPDVAPQAQRADVTRTGVTVVVPPQLQAERAARAFEGPPAPEPSAPAPPTRRDTPLARDPSAPREASSPRFESFDSLTEVRAPAFTPAELVEGALPPPAVERPRMNATLRSAERPPEVAALAKPPLDKTVPMPGRPLPPPPAPGPAPAVVLSSVPPAAAPAAAPAPAPLSPSGAPPPLRSFERPVAVPLRPRTVVLVVTSAVVSLALFAAIVWLAVRALAP